MLSPAAEEAFHITQIQHFNAQKCRKHILTTWHLFWIF